MTQTPHLVSQPELRQTPTGWLAIGHSYPRIAVVADTPAEAAALFAESCTSWFSTDQEVDRDDHVGANPV